MWEGCLDNNEEADIELRVKITRVPSTILEGKLYLSCDTVPENREVLDRYQIKGIVVALSMEELIHYPYHPSPLAYCLVPIQDSRNEPIETYFEQCCQFIDETPGAVLVHCAAGVSRSATLVIAYLMKRKGMPFLEAYSFVKERRPIIRPNEGFLIKLQSLPYYSHSK